MTGPTAPTSPSTSPAGAARWGWRVTLGVAVLLLINGVGLYLVIVETHTERTIGLLLTAVGALALLAAVDGLRSGGSLARRLAWGVAATLAAIGLHSLRSDRLDLVGFYVVLAAIATVGAVLTRPRAEEAP